jgi:hypothetical protein
MNFVRGLLRPAAQPLIGSSSETPKPCCASLAFIQPAVDGPTAKPI